MLDQMRKQKLSKFKWTREVESLMENTLLKHNHDFSRAAKEMTEIVNKDSKGEFIIITDEILKFRWNDFKIR